MLEEFQKILTENSVLLKNSKLLLALSGGVDSCVLLDLCLKSGLSPAVAHCNFQLRDSESDADADWVKNLAQQKELKYHVQTFETQTYADQKKRSIQMAARDLRYDWFESLSQKYGYDLILVAHHADDALETFMINAMRGSGLKGLLGIPERRGKILRLLLSFSREQIMHYAQENKILWREDSSNAQSDYLRNALRHDVIPKWKEKAPNFDSQFRETLQHLAHAQNLLEEVIQSFKKNHFHKHDGGFRIAVKALEGLGSPDYCLHALFAPYGFKQLSDLKQLLHAQSGKQLFSDSHRLVKDRECFLLTPIQFSESISYDIHAQDTSVETPKKLIFSEEKSFVEVDCNSLLLDKSKLKFPLTLRKWKQSDYFYPNGLGGKKKLSKYFKDEKFSLLDKESQWLLCSQEDIVWVIGKRADQRFLATPTTENKWLVRCDD